MNVSGPIVDGDSHVEEPEEVWDYLEDGYRDRRPRLVDLRGMAGIPEMDAFWLIDGRLYPKPVGHWSTISGSPPTSTFAQNKQFGVGSQTLMDVDARLKDLDRFGIDVQVNFPTTFLGSLTEDREYEAALIRAYNNWVADRSGRCPDRLKWAAVLPLKLPDEAAAEVERAKQLGASSAVIFGTFSETMLHDPTLDVVWAECERQNLPITMHVGWGHPGIHASCDSLYAGNVFGVTMPVMLGFYSFVCGGILERYPGLRVAFVEAGADWVVYLLQRMDHYFRAYKEYPWMGTPKRRPSDIVRDGNIYLFVEAEEQLLPLVIERVGEDHVLLGADMPHAEERENSLTEIKERNDISESVKRKLVGPNAIRFYGL